MRAHSVHILRPEVSREKKHIILAEAEWNPFFLFSKHKLHDTIRNTEYGIEEREKK